MSYKLRFHVLALKEWHKLDSTLQGQFKNKLMERLENPHVPTAALHGMDCCYKIKLKKVGYRLVYRVEDAIVFVTVISVGKRDKLKVYNGAQDRL